MIVCKGLEAGSTFMNAGLLDEADREFTRALRLLECGSTQDSASVAEVRLCLAEAKFVRADWPSARRHAREAADILLHLDPRHREGPLAYRASVLQGASNFRLGAFRTARPFLEAASEYERDAGHFTEPSVDSDLADCLAALGLWEQALEPAAERAWRKAAASPTTTKRRVFRAGQRYSKVLRRLGRLDEAWAVLRGMLLDHDIEDTWHEIHRLCSTFYDAGRNEDAKALFEEVESEWERKGPPTHSGEEPEGFADKIVAILTAKPRRLLRRQDARRVSELIIAGRHESSDEFLEAVHGACETLGRLGYWKSLEPAIALLYASVDEQAGPRSCEAAQLLGMLGWINKELGREDLAETQLKVAMSGEVSAAQSAANVLAHLYRLQERYEDALKVHQARYARLSYNRDFMALSLSLSTGEDLTLAGRYRDAEPLLRAHVSREPRSAADQTMTLCGKFWLARALHGLGRSSEALDLWQQAKGLLQVSLGSHSGEPPEELDWIYGLCGEVAEDLSQGDEAVIAYLWAIELAERGEGKNRPLDLKYRARLGSLLMRMGRMDEGRRLLQQVLYWESRMRDRRCSPVVQNLRAALACTPGSDAVRS